VSWSCRGGCALRSAKGFSTCGDAVFAWSAPGGGLFVVVDALGHGPDAAASAAVVAQVVARECRRPLPELFLGCDRALAGHRGVVMSALQLRDERVLFAGIGNVEIYGPPDTRRPPTSAGVVGRGLRGVREWTLEVEDGHRWVLASDGVQRRMAPKAIGETRALPVEEAAEKVLQLAGREDDDVAVVVVDWSRS
jgi:phosphoserine phosphatase RsbX